MMLDERLPKPPIIIGGCGRSGTTLLASILSAHPAIQAIPYETQVFCPTGYDGRLDLTRPLELDRARDVLRNTDVKASATRWCEKTPKNIRFFRQILDTFGEDVRLIHIVRDGRDVITSRHPKAPDRTWVALDRWVEDVSAGRPFDDHSQVLMIRYENLIARFEATMTEICAFIDEPLDEKVLNWQQHATVSTNAAWTNTIQNVHARSVGKWRNPENAALVSALMADPEAVNLLKHYGYLPLNARGVGTWRPIAVMRRLKRQIPEAARLRVKGLVSPLRASKGGERSTT